MSKLVQHHEKYQEIHGEDKLVLLTRSEHTKLHIRLRKEGKCAIPVDELRKIHGSAKHRLDSYKEYQQQPKQREFRKRYAKEHTECLRFISRIGLNTFLWEKLFINTKTGSVTYCSWFGANHGNKLCVISEK